MILIIGLGNPGEKYENTRHNTGFIALDEFQKKNDFPDFKFSKKFSAEISEGNFGDQNVLLAKPQTFMNKSGTAVKLLIQNSKATLRGVRRFAPSSKIQNLVVIHDDIDLPFGEIKIVKNRGSAGHKGVESIIKAIGNENLIRLRVGISPKQFRALNHGTGKAGGVVLKKFSKEEKEVVKNAALALEELLKNGLESAMNKYN